MHWRLTSVRRLSGETDPKRAPKGQVRCARCGGSSHAHPALRPKRCSKPPNELGVRWRVREQCVRLAKPKGGRRTRGVRRRCGTPLALRGRSGSGNVSVIVVVVVRIVAAVRGGTPAPSRRWAPLKLQAPTRVCGAQVPSLQGFERNALEPTHEPTRSHSAFLVLCSTRS